MKNQQMPLLKKISKPLLEGRRGVLATCIRLQESKTQDLNIPLEFSRDIHGCTM